MLPTTICTPIDNLLSENKVSSSLIQAQRMFVDTHAVQESPHAKKTCCNGDRCCIRKHGLIANFRRRVYTLLINYRIVDNLSSFYKQPCKHIIVPYLYLTTTKQTNLQGKNRLLCLRITQLDGCTHLRPVAKNLVRVMFCAGICIVVTLLLVINDGKSSVYNATWWIITPILTNFSFL